MTNWLDQLKAKSAEQGPLQSESLEEVLLDMGRYGMPKVGQYSSSGWHSHIDANITAIGAKFEVRSEFGMKTPLAAALQCRNRLHAAIEMLGGKA